MLFGIRRVRLVRIGLVGGRVLQTVDEFLVLGTSTLPIPDAFNCMLEFYSIKLTLIFKRSLIFLGDI